MWRSGPAIFRRRTSAASPWQPHGWDENADRCRYTRLFDMYIRHLELAIIIARRCCAVTALPNMQFMQRHLDFSDEEVLSFVETLQNNRAHLDVSKASAVQRYTWVW